MSSIKVKSCEPIYTGGGITVFIGQLSDGVFFMADDCNYDIMLLDSDPLEAGDDAWYWDWQKAHVIRDLDGKGSLSLFRKILDWVVANNPIGNYAMSDIMIDIEQIEKMQG